ncbi:hypothetical protein EV586_105208 [Tumebacillus sp. BK434]|uniref:hypothetical protein n=1 Tax=Tumebacillus sp. BK434 TaxID=2512169 RepID=UPI00104DEB46|nr:hypothetical protein [Tumebacillus sp. BK434]TCP53863.1 hypothetical protein EV586_105208 [Tumebacillus sp. BK434]
MGTEERKDKLRSASQEAGFFEALQAVEEQAGALSLPTDAERLAPRSIRAQVVKKHSAGWKLPRWLLMLIGASLLGNIGLGAMYFLKQGAAPAPVEQPPVVSEDAEEPAKPADAVTTFLPKTVVWNKKQLEELSEKERRDVESHLAAMPTGRYFVSGFFNLLFIPGDSKLQMDDTGAVSVKMFLYNGYLRNFTPKRIVLSAYYYEGVVFNGTIEGPLDEWLPGEVRMLEMRFAPDEVKDPKLVKKLIEYKAEQDKLSIQARFVVDEPNLMNPLVAEPVWMFFNTHTAVTGAGK